MNILFIQGNPEKSLSYVTIALKDLLQFVEGVINLSVGFWHQGYSAGVTDPGGGNLSFQDTGLCHSNRKSTTHKSGEISQKYTHKSGEFLKIIPISPGMLKKLTNN